MLARTVKAYEAEYGKLMVELDEARLDLEGSDSELSSASPVAVAARKLDVGVQVALGPDPGPRSAGASHEAQGPWGRTNTSKAHEVEDAAGY